MIHLSISPLRSLAAPGSERKIAFLLAVMLLLSAACSQEPRTPDRAEDRAAVQERAELFLANLKAESWLTAANFVVLDETTRERMNVPLEASDESSLATVADWMQSLYGTVSAGSVYSVELHPQDEERAVVTYRHDDLDSFHMRKVDGEWFYTLSW